MKYDGYKFRGIAFWELATGDYLRWDGERHTLISAKEFEKLMNSLDEFDLSNPDNTQDSVENSGSS